MLEEEAALLESVEVSQITGLKHKEIPLGDDVDCQPSKKAKEKQPVRYQENIGIKLGSAHHCKRCMYARQDCLVHNSR